MSSIPSGVCYCHAQCSFAQKVVMLSFVLAIVMLNIVGINVAMLTVIYAECNALLLYWASLC